MNNVKIRINIEFEECNDVISGDPKKETDGNYTMTITENDSIDIDKCESAMMKTVYPTIREALSRHFTAVSKKKLLRKPNPEKRS